MYIVFLLILTVILFKTLFSTFGFTTTQDITKRDEAIKKFIGSISTNKKQEKENNSNITKEEDIIFFKDIYKNYTEKQEETKKQEEKTDLFDEQKFLKLSEKAVVAILNSFSTNKLDELKELLTPKMFKVFEKNILESQKQDMFCKTVIVSVNDKNILEKVISDCFSSVKLSLKMQQINYIENSNGEVISGSKDRVNNISEIWIFTKTSNDKYWLLDSIE